MKIGEKSILTCSPEFAYGARGRSASKHRARYTHISAVCKDRASLASAVRSSLSGCCVRCSLAPDLSRAFFSPPKIPANATLEFEVELLSFDNTQNVTEDKQVKKSVTVVGSGYNRPNDNATVKVKFSGKVKGAHNNFVEQTAEPVEIKLGADPNTIWGLEVSTHTTERERRRRQQLQ